jgi:hypothetical protein
LPNTLREVSYIFVFAFRDQSNENVTSLLESVDLAGDPHDQTTDQHDSDQSKVNEPVAARPKPVFVDEVR